MSETEQPEDVDPTRIDIATDPTTRRFRGTAYHGNTPFDAPFISELADNLWQGGCETGLVLPTFIDHVVSLYPWERYVINHGATYQEIKMYDSISAGPSPEQVDDIAQTVNALRETGAVLVHCQAGLNRSSLVAARALFLSTSMSPDEIISHIRTTRSPACLCNPAFEEQVRSWTREEANA